MRAALANAAPSALTAGAVMQQGGFGRESPVFLRGAGCKIFSAPSASPTVRLCDTLTLARAMTAGGNSAKLVAAAKRPRISVKDFAAMQFPGRKFEERRDMPQVPAHPATRGSPGLLGLIRREQVILVLDIGGNRRRVRLGVAVRVGRKRGGDGKAEDESKCFHDNDPFAYPQKNAATRPYVIGARELRNT